MPTARMLVVAALLGAAAASLQCRSGEIITFDKQLGVRPADHHISSAPKIFSYRPGDTPSTDWITIECVKRCREYPDCSSVLVQHQQSLCLGFGHEGTKDLVADPDAALFVKLCMQVPQQCRHKLWTVETSPGYHLISDNGRVFENVTSMECSALLTAAGPSIRSSQFMPQRSSSAVVHVFDGSHIDNDPTIKGRCIVSWENKYTRTEAYRVANGEVYYKENQCTEDYAQHIDRCSYEEYYNQTLKHHDVVVHGISTPECKRRCESEPQFNCRGFTTIPYESRPYYGQHQQSGVEPKICLLHSEDALGLGSWLLTARAAAVYYRRVLCLNVTVECTPSAMTVTYWPRSDFRGRLYVSGHPDTCATVGQGLGGPTRLVVPFEQCGVRSAFSLVDDEGNPENRTLMYTMLVIQNNPIIQAQGDRFLRAGCVAVPALNVSLGTDISVGGTRDDQVQVDSQIGSLSQPASSVINTTGSAAMPRVRMYIINEPDVHEQMGQINGGAVALGETIELRIDADLMKRGLIDVHAYHLVAASQLGDSSVLLLDGRGCPTNQVDFPPFQRTITSGVVRLSSRFKAFRFPNSHVVKFSVMVQFCVGPCPPVSCDSASRRTRSAEPTENATVWMEADEHLPIDRSMRMAHVVVASTGSALRVKDMCREVADDTRLPLELSLVVASNDAFAADRLIYGEGSRAVGGNYGYNEAPRSICIHEALFITAAFAWLVVQVLILAGCLIVVRRYKSIADDRRDHKDYHSFDNIGFDSSIAGRRVHWPDQSVDILHAN